MESRPTPWIEALRRSHNALRAVIEPLDVGQLQRGSYASDWSIAQVLAHLGSQGQIFNLFLDSGLSGEDPPGREAFPPIWDAWNARSPEAQAADFLRVDEAMVQRFESLDDTQREQLHLDLFGMALDTTGLARMRLGEHALHSWDVRVALDPAATVASDAVNLLIDTLDQLVGRTGKPDGAEFRAEVSTSEPERHFTLEVGEAVILAPSAGGEGLPELRLPAEGFVRLVYGRLDPAHTPPLKAQGVDLERLRGIFPGV